MARQRLTQTLSITAVLLCLLMPARLLAAETFVIVASINSPLPTLSRYQLSSIFLDKSRDVHGMMVQPVDRDDWPGVKKAFYSHVVRKNASQLNAYWARKLFTGRGKPPRSVADTRAVYQFLAVTPHAIAYMTPDNVDSQRVKVLYRPELEAAE